MNFKSKNYLKSSFSSLLLLLLATPLLGPVSCGNKEMDMDKRYGNTTDYVLRVRLANQSGHEIPRAQAEILLPIKKSATHFRNSISSPVVADDNAKSSLSIEIEDQVDSSYLRVSSESIANGAVYRLKVPLSISFGAISEDRDNENRPSESKEHSGPIVKDLGVSPSDFFKLTRSQQFAQLSAEAADIYKAENARNSSLLDNEALDPAASEEKPNYTDTSKLVKTHLLRKAFEARGIKATHWIGFRIEAEGSSGFVDSWIIWEGIDGNQMLDLDVIEKSDFHYIAVRSVSDLDLTGLIDPVSLLVSGYGLTSDLELKRVKS